MKFIIALCMVFSGCLAFATTGYKTTTGVTATATSTKVLNINGLRTYLLIQNKGANSVIVNTAEQTGAHEGVLIPAGGNYEPVLAPINAIWIETLTSTSAVSIIEGQ